MPSREGSRLELARSPTPAERRILDLATDVAAEDAAGQAEIGARIASGSVVYWGSCRGERPPGVLDGGWLVLSQEFYDEVLAHPVPLDHRLLRGLTSSFALDLYAWTTYRVSRLRQPVAIPWEELARQFGSQEKALRNFRLRCGRGWSGYGSSSLDSGSRRARRCSGSTPAGAMSAPVSFSSRPSRPAEVLGNRGV